MGSTEERADRFFHALSDSTRRDILRRVLAGEHSVTALSRHYDMSFAAVQKHVAVLQQAELITKRRHGREQLASGDIEAVRSVADLLAEFEQIWRGRIDRMDELLSQRPADPSDQVATGTTPSTLPARARPSRKPNDKGDPDARH